MKSIHYFLTALTFIIFSCKSKTEKTATTEELKSGNDITGNFTLPPLSQPGQGAYLSGELIYPLDNKPTPECHASTILETPTGLVSAFFAGTHEKNPDVGIRVSRMVDGKWTWPEEVANGVQNDTLRYPLWNPVLFQPKEGPLLLFYKEGPDPRTWWGMLMTSSDGGITWSKPEKMGTDEKIGHLLGPVKNKPIQLEDGTIISPSSTEIKLEDGDVDWMVHFEISKDNGKTWEVVGPINDGKEFDAIQPSILTYPNGKMQVLCRTRQNVISQSWSEDQGQTWSKMTATELPNPNSGTDAVTLKDNRQLLIYNHTTKEGEEPKGRNMINLAISEDGINWKPVMTLENVPAESGYSYPAIIQTSDGLAHITYTYVRQSVKHVVIDPKQL
ncbi:sialidase family protein [Arenibacter palladensis]|uniref:sialidase family protein n=1 Tax=Arenibacter palladensis TaxID=237373 RepID=UPI0026E27DFD|nr:sialidase family protein [Arenibacter palladensis]MDO6603960.1 sialidase family protein [Arenibacter palladensis]